MTRLVIHIDKLVLRGVDRADAAALSAAIQDALTHLLASPGLSPPAPSHVTPLSPLHLPAGAGTTALANGVAARIALEVRR